MEIWICKKNNFSLHEIKDQFSTQENQQLQMGYMYITANYMCKPVECKSHGRGGWVRLAGAALRGSYAPQS